ncbi:MAG TPA: methyltransferase domain-containing protein [Chloroflexia bacterium]|nr:methyltransferase domain-containing protein [Chloroflexia bacterium]
MSEFTGAISVITAPVPPANPLDLRTPNLLGYRRAARMLLVQPGMRVLDVGCGWGTGAWLLAMLGAHVTAVDSVPEALEWARITYGEQPLRRGGRLTYEPANLMTWQPPAAYDAVIVQEIPASLTRRPATEFLRRMLQALDLPDVPPAAGWHDGLYLHLPLRRGYRSWPPWRVIVRRRGGPRLSDSAPRPGHSVSELAALARSSGGQLLAVELRAGKLRLRALERLVCAGTRPLLVRAGVLLMTQADALILPELVAALRAAPTDGTPLPDS